MMSYDIYQFEKDETGYSYSFFANGSARYHSVHGSFSGRTDIYMRPPTGYEKMWLDALISNDPAWDTLRSAANIGKLFQEHLPFSFREVIDSFLASCTEAERTTLTLVYGIGQEAVSYRAAGERLGCTQETIRLRINMLLRRLYSVICLTEKRKDLTIRVFSPKLHTALTKYFSNNAVPLTEAAKLSRDELSNIPGIGLGLLREYESTMKSLGFSFR